MRYTGSKAKRCRATGINLYGNEKFDRLKKQYPPGQHGHVRKKRSDYARHLLEKQKIKWTYGVTEKQLLKIYKEASKSKAVTGTRLLQLLECHLDNILFRSGLFNSRDQARQIISHGHLLVNEQRLSIPSARLRVGDVVTFRQKSLKSIRNMIRTTGFHYLNGSRSMTESCETVPAREQIDQSFNEQLLVEFYSPFIFLSILR
jgi:ribosomal protein S4, bacterial/organelle type